jgi:hypothetical protein
MIRKEEVAQVSDCTGGVKSYWHRKVEQFAEADLGYNTCDKLKEAILSDFTAWGTLGSFMTSISFGILCVDHSDRVVSLLSFHGLVLILFMYAALMALHCVLAGTFKYIYFSSAPSTVIVLTLCDYLQSNMNSSSPVIMSRIEKMKRYLIPHKWDHMTPLQNSITAVCLGFTITIMVNTNNPYITLIVAAFCTIFLTAVKSLRDDVWNHSPRYTALRPRSRRRRRSTSTSKSRSNLSVNDNDDNDDDNDERNDSSHHHNSDDNEDIDTVVNSNTKQPTSRPILYRRSSRRAIPPKWKF